MKKNLVAGSILILASLACQTLISEPQTVGETQIVTETAPAVVTETPVTLRPRPTPHPITCIDDSCLDACLIRINSALETHQFEAVGGAYEGKGANLNLVVYQVDNGSLREPALLYVPNEFIPYQEDFESQLLVWNYASALLPPEHLKWITEYYVFTDDPQNTLAWVNNRDVMDRSRWQLGIDILDAQDPVYLTSTLMHEFGHLITLNSDQIPQTDSFFSWSQSSANCKQLATPEGCSNPDSYINLFYRTFWVDIFEEWRETVEQQITGSDEEFYNLVDEFYSRHEDEFIRSYAATNIREDMAESFENFVLNPKPAGNYVFEKKMNFFYDFPELIALRRQIIQNVCSYTPE